MKCLKIRHPVLTYSLFAFFASVFFCVFGLSQESYATSFNCSISSVSSGSVYAPANVCTDFTDQYNSWYDHPFYFYDLSFSFSSLNNSPTLKFYSQFDTSSSIYFATSGSGSYSFSGLFFVSPQNYQSGSFYYKPPLIGFSSFTGSISDFSFKIATSLSDLSSCPECNVIKFRVIWIVWNYRTSLTNFTFRTRR